MSAPSHACPLVLLAVLCLGCGSSPTGNNGGGDGDIQANAALQFVPGQLTVTQGASVTWDFGPVAHTVVFDQVSGRPADIATTANQSVSRTFGSVGTFPYTCSIHPGMDGTITVTAPGATQPPPPPPPPPGYP